LLLDLPFLLVFVAVMFAYSWQLTLIALAILTVICLISVLVVPRIKSIMRPTNASAAMMIIAKLLSRTAIPSNAYIIDGGCEEIVTKL